jgi:hypothetical protein
MGFFKKSNATELSIPPTALATDKATEVVRVWVADGNLQVSLAAMAWDDPFAWGIMLVDLTRHVAKAYEQTTGLEESKAWARIKAGFDAEWSDPTDKPTGNILK